MNPENAPAKDNKEKQKKISIKLDWIFGIRKDLLPNVLMLDINTVVYPAGHYVVVLNISKEKREQRFIAGTPHSKGFTAINVYNQHKRYVATAEELEEGVLVSIYVVNNPIAGQFNWISKIVGVDLTESRILKVFHIAFSLRDRFSVFKNDNFILVSDQFVLSYSIHGKMLTNTHRYPGEANSLPSQILSHCWFYDGHFCIATENNIIILDSNLKPFQVIQTYDEINKTNLTYVLPGYEGEKFIAVGNNKRFEMYEKKKSEYYERVLSKTFEDKNDREKSDKDKNFDFHTLSSPMNCDEFILASTSNNDLIQITLKDIEKQFNYKYLISQFHSDSVEGMDIAVNKPYIITCSKDKSLKVWDYNNKNLALSKSFEEEMYSVAYHPSGMHCIVSFEDKIIPMNVYYDEISNMTQNGIQARKSKDVFNFLKMIFIKNYLFENYKNNFR